MTPCPEYTPGVLKPPYFYQYLIGVAFLRHFKLDEINAFCEYTLDHRGPTVKWTCTGYSHSTCAILTLSHVSLKYSSWAPSVSFLGDRYFRTYRLIVSMATHHARHVTQRTQPHSSVWRFSTAWYGTVRYGTVRFTFGGFSTGYCTWYLILF